MNWIENKSAGLKTSLLAAAGEAAAKEHYLRLEPILTPDMRAKGLRFAREFKPKVEGAK